MSPSPRVDEILSWLDAYAPFRYAESWDRCGLQVGDPHAEVSRILVALDPNSKTLQEAESHRCQCLVTHHPLFLRPLNAVRLDQFPASLIARALRGGVHLIAMHTNLDAAREGTNDHLARLFALHGLEPLQTDPAWQQESLYGGMGRIGFLPEPQTFIEVVEHARKVFGPRAGIRAVGNPQRRVHRVGLCSGSGGSLLERVIASGCDIYITGDLKYHEAQQAIEAGLALLDVGHFGSERLMVAPLAAYLRSQAFREGQILEVLEAREEKDPFWSL